MEGAALIGAGRLGGNAAIQRLHQFLYNAQAKTEAAPGIDIAGAIEEFKDFG